MGKIGKNKSKIQLYRTLEITFTGVTNKVLKQKKKAANLAVSKNELKRKILNVCNLCMTTAQLKIVYLIGVNFTYSLGTDK